MSKKQSPSLNRENATSNVLNMSEVADVAREGMFKTEILRLEAHNVGLSQTIDNLLKSLENKDSEINHLKQMLMGSVPLIDGGIVLASDEIVIIDIQIRKLKEATQNREMTLDEVKKLDLLIKNKKLLMADQKPQKKDELPRDVTPTQLLAIASTKIKQD